MIDWDAVFSNRLSIGTSLEFNSLEVQLLLEIVQSSQFRNNFGYTSGIVVTLEDWDIVDAVLSDITLKLMRNSIMIGEIKMLAVNDAPENFLLCNGALLNRVDYPLLYEAIGTNYIVDTDTFYLPDFVNRFPLGSLPLGQNVSGGEAEVTLSVNEMPAHNHDTLPHSHGYNAPVPIVVNGGLEAPANSASVTPAVTSTSDVTVLSSGGGEPHNNMPPYSTIAYFIRYQ